MTCLVCEGVGKYRGWCCEYHCGLVLKVCHWCDGTGSFTPE